MKKNFIKNDLYNEVEEVKPLSKSSNSKKIKITIEDLQNIPKDYSPLDDKNEYMNINQRIYFFNVLSNLRYSSIKDIEGADLNIASLRDLSESDEVDIASRYTEMSNALLQKERLINLVKKIDQLLDQIEEGTYGYCQETGKEIGIKRLIANPTATKCIQIQAKIEVDINIAKNTSEDE
jgi:DnaK suppressor protein